MTEFLRAKLAMQRVLERRVNAYVLFPLIAAVVILAIWWSTFRVIAVESASAERRAAESALEQIETYEAQTIRNLNAIDQTLKTISYIHLLQADRPILSDLAEKGVIPPALVFSIAIADKTGRIREGTEAAERGVISDQPFFIQHRESKLDLPAVTLVPSSTGKHKLQFSRRLNTPQEDFDGVAMVSVHAEYFTSSYDSARFGEWGLLGLVADNGRFLVKRTGDMVTSGDDAGPEVTGEDFRSVHSMLVKHAWDGVERYTNARTLYGFPLSVVVGLAQTEQLASFRQQERIYLGSATIVTLLLAAVTALLTHLSWKMAKDRARVRKAQETYYAASEASLEAILVWRRVEVGDPLGTTNDFVLDNINHRGAQLFNSSKTALLGRTVHELLPESADNGFYDELETVVQTGTIRELEWENDFPALRAKWLYRQVIQVEDGVVVILRDISERREAEARISHMAHHDALTGLPNRTLLEQRLQQAMQHARTRGQPVAVVFVDLDNFKLVNDGLGHKAGDELLKIVSRRMERCVRSIDTVVRLGGDEFVMVLRGEMAQNERLEMLLKQVGAAIAEPIYLNNQRFEITSSSGVALYPRDGSDIETLLSNADAAMYEAKAQGRNNFQFYSPDMHERVMEKLALQEGLRNAVARDELFLVYQPQVDLRSGFVIGVEALLRWRHPRKGILLPSDFIALAEENGTIISIGEWVLRTACRQNKAWQDEGLFPFVVSVNVSTRQFQEGTLLDKVSNALRDSGLDACYLNLEVTESLIMQDVQQAVLLMQELKAMDVQLSIDDFGTGYSSLSALKSFPITSLKLDRSFVSDLCVDRDDEAITKAVIALGHELDLQVVAEGVETQEQLDFLLDYDCDAAQGFYFGEPVSAQALPACTRVRHNLLMKAAAH